MPFRAGRFQLPHNVAIALISALCLLVVGFDLYRTWEARSEVIDASRRETANLVRSVAQHAEVALRQADASVTGLVQQLDANGIDPPQIQRLHERMAQEVANRIVTSMTVFDAAGNAMVSSATLTSPVNVADRPFFQHSLNHPDHETFVGGALRSRLTGHWVLGLARRLDHPDGSFAGVVTAAIDADHFLDFYGTFDIGHDGSVALYGSDGKILIRRPFRDSDIGSDQSGSPLFRGYLSKAENGTNELQSPIDGVVRYRSYRPLSGYPLIATVGLGKDEQLANWRAGARQHLLAAVATVLLLGIFAFGLSRQMGLLDKARKAALQTNAELDSQAHDLATARDLAESASAAKSRFLTGITHELRTPLHGILGYAEMLSLEGGLSPTQSARLEAMMTAGQYLLSTINAVLDMSQIEADRLELQPTPIELHEVLRTCFDVVRPAAEAKGLGLIRPPATPPIQLFADPTRLREVLINLLGNAIKFTPSGTVEVRLRQIDAGERIRFEIVDTGPGIWARHRDKLFQIFERLNVNATIGVEGTGLGLAMSARLVRLMGGDIGYSDNPGGGSVFWLELPRGTDAPVQACSAMPPAPSRRPHLRVLVVDDEALNRSIASGFLTLAGHEAVCVDSGTAALEAAANQDFDVILMDVRMPGMSGLQATRLIRALPGGRGQVRVVAVTAQAFAQQIELCRLAGMNGHVAKPFQQAVLLAALEEPAPKPGAGDPDAELPVFDRATFDDVARLLLPADTNENLRTMLARGDWLFHALRAPGMLSRVGQLAEDAHRLAGGAGSFGFLSLAAAARAFERAADTEATDIERIAARLTGAIEAVLALARDELAATAVIEP